jgi:hypothetical protein
MIHKIPVDPEKVNFSEFAIGRRGVRQDAHVFAGYAILWYVLP